MGEKENDFYQHLRKDIREWLKTRTGSSSKWSEYILLAPDLFHLLVKLALDKDVPSKEKAKLAGAIAYFVSPIDLIPEALVGPLGYADDVALAAYVLNSVMKNCDSAIVTKHWAGQNDVLELVQKIVEIADEMLGSGLWKKLRKMVD